MTKDDKGEVSGWVAALVAGVVGATLFCWAVGLPISWLFYLLAGVFVVICSFAATFLAVYWALDRWLQ